MNQAKSLPTSAYTDARSSKALEIASVVFALTLALAGGSSRGDVLAFVAVEVAAVAVLFVALFTHGSTGFRRIGLPLLFVSLIAAVATAQLVPLAPVIWNLLPGHEFYSNASRAAGLADPFRPLSLSPDRTADSLIGLLPIFAAVAAAGLGTQRFVRGSATVLLVMATCSVVLAAFQMSAGPDTSLRFYQFTNTDAGVGLLANRNHQAVFLAMAIPAAVAWAMHPGRVIAPPLVRLTLGASMVALFLAGGVLTGSRTGLVMCALALAGAGAIAWPYLRAVPGKLKAGVMGALAAAACAVAYYSASGHRIVAENVHADPRGWFWPHTIQLIKMFFPFGGGMGTFENVYPRVESLSELTPEYANKAHNDLLEIGFEAGLFAYALFAAFVAWWLTQSYRVWRAPQRSIPNLLWARVASLIIGLGVLASATDYPLRTPLVGSIFCIASVLLHRIARELTADCQTR